MPFRPHFGPQDEFLGTKGDETLFTALIEPNLVWWTLFGIEQDKDTYFCNWGRNVPFLETKLDIFGLQNDFLGAYRDETLFIAQIGPNLV